MPSPYPWHYSLRWPIYYHWPSTKQHSAFSRPALNHRFLEVRSDEISCLFCGDIMVLQNDVIPTLSHELSQLIASVDLMIGNCEAPVGSHDADPKRKYHMSFHMPRANLESIIAQSGLAPERWLLSYANNHSFDEGYQACLDSEKILLDMGVSAIGGYHEGEDPLSIYEYQGIRLGVCGWTHWMNKPQKNPPTIGVYHQQHIFNHNWQQLKAKHRLDFLIGLPHWEYEFQHFARPKTRLQAKTLIQYLGFDFILGSHPHTLQGMEKFDRGLCQYSLGNFVGLGVAWPVKLVPLLELKCQKINANKTEISAYQFHFFVQEHRGKEVHIIPLAQANPRVKEKMKKRIALLFKGHIE